MRNGRQVSCRAPPTLDLQIGEAHTAETYPRCLVKALLDERTSFRTKVQDAEYIPTEQEGKQ